MAMIFSDPSKIVFESDMDIVHYVAGGTVPSRKNFESLMNALRVPANDDVQMELVECGEVKPITINMTSVPDPELLEKYMREIYECRKKERIANIIGFVTFGATMLSLGMSLGRRSAEKDLRNSSVDTRYSLCVGNELVDGDIPGIN